MHADRKQHPICELSSGDDLEHRPPKCLSVSQRNDSAFGPTSYETANISSVGSLGNSCGRYDSLLIVHIRFKSFLNRHRSDGKMKNEHHKDVADILGHPKNGQEKQQELHNRNATQQQRWKIGSGASATMSRSQTAHFCMPRRKTQKK